MAIGGAVVNGGLIGGESGAVEFPVYPILDGPYAGMDAAKVRLDERLAVAAEAGEPLGDGDDREIESVAYFPAEVIVTGNRGMARYAIEPEPEDPRRRVARFVRMG